MAKSKAEEIMDQVGDQEAATLSLRTRFMEDEQRYDIVPHVRPDSASSDVAYTTNRQRQNADRLIAIIKDAKLVVRSELVGREQSDRELGRLAERFFKQCLRQVDRKNARGVQPASLRGILSYFAVVRGWIAAYHGMARIESVTRGRDGRTTKRVRSEPVFRWWDPYNVYWDVGQDGELDWVCNANRMTAEGIESMYPGLRLSGPPKGYTSKGQGLWPVYEYYDRTMAYLIADGKNLRPPVPHGARDRVPASVVPVGDRPLVNIGTKTAPIDGLGLSCFAQMRMAVEQMNEYVSIGRDMAHKALEPVTIWKTLYGTKELKDEDNLNRPGAVVVISKEDEDVEQLPPVTTTIDYDKVLSVILSDMSGSTLPPQAFGDLDQRAMSGYALNQLTKTIKYMVKTFIEAIEAVYIEAEDCIREMYGMTTESGAPVHDPVFLGGIPTPHDEMERASAPEIELKLQLPGDDVAKVAVAQQLTQGDRPLDSVEHVQNDTLEFDDPDMVRESIELQKLRDGLPLAKLLVAMRTAEKNGDKELKDIYEREYKKVQFTEDLQMKRLEAAAAQGVPGEGPESAAAGREGGGQGGAPSPTLIGADPKSGITQASRGASPPTPDARNTMGGRPEGS